MSMMMSQWMQQFQPANIATTSPSTCTPRMPQMPSPAFNFNMMLSQMTTPPSAQSSKRERDDDTTVEFTPTKLRKTTSGDKSQQEAPTPSPGDENNFGS